MWPKLLSYMPGWSAFVQAVLLLIIPLLLLQLSNGLRRLITRTFALKPNNPSPPRKESSARHTPLTESYTQNMAAIRTKLGRHADVLIREFMIGNTNCRAALVFTDGLLNVDVADSHIIEPLMLLGIPPLERDQAMKSASAFKEYISHHLLPVSDMDETTAFTELAQGVLFGRSALLVDGIEGAILIGSSSGKSRSITDPISEALLRGPRVGFTERLSENTGILRMQGKNESLVMTRYEVGTRLKKDLVLAYMEDIADPKLIEEVDSRLRKIDIDAVLESGYIEQLIEDNSLSPFQQIHNTERPDRVMAALLEGRVAILLDGTPFALILPATFSMMLQAPEDYYERWISGSLIRALRFFAALLAIMAPALYISFISYHPGLIPTKLVMSIIKTRQGVPFPSIIEALIMEISIEVLREAGIRLPKPIGPAMGIIGGLIIGDAAVAAGIVSPFLVIVVAVTAISSFVIPVYSAGITLRILRFTGMFSAAVLGLFGVVMFFLLICSHLVRLKSFGVIYTSPMIPYGIGDWKDAIFRLPLKVMKKRPKMFNPQDPDRRN